MPVSADKTRWFFSLYLNGLKQAFLLSGNHDWIFATCNFYISCHEHREHAWIKFNKQVGHWDCYLFFKAWMVRGNTSKLFRTLIVWRSIKPFESTAVASMRGTEALASVKFYQILSIFIFFMRLIILEDFIRLISYNGPCVRLGCSFFLATALERRFLLLSIEGKERRSVTSGYHGSNILSFKRPFRTEPAICIVKG